MTNWAKLIGIALAVTIGILIVNEMTSSPQKIKSKSSNPPSPIGGADFRPRTSLELPSFEGKKEEKTKKVLPPLFSDTGDKARTRPQRNPNPTAPTNAPPPSGRTSNNNSSGGGGSGGGGSGGGGSGTGTGTSNTQNNGTTPGGYPQEEYPKVAPEYWIEESPSPTYNGARHNNTCTRFLRTPGKPGKKDEGTPCPDCGG